MSTSVVKQIADLERASTADLQRRWQQLIGTEPPRYNREFLIRRLAHRLQELTHGGLSQASRAKMDRLLEEAGYDEIAASCDHRRPPHDRRGVPMPGTRLIREWNGEQHEVTVAESGIEYRGRRYSSLSAVATAITGTHWNGPAFFGLRPRRKESCPMRRQQPSDKGIAPTQCLPCAAYTRTSTEEGLDSEFNSLDAQRESAEAYIASQKHEGWVASPTRYDDAGYSGGTLERPALQRLLEDVEAGRIGCVVVYKVDRISRSLLDFARLMEIFDRHGVSFVSVTQQFNTTTSMGRLVLNILLSFAQFEREIIGERIRDKVAATKKKGKYCGGPPVLGYDVDRERKRLVVNSAEAELVRHIFEDFVRAGSTTALARELNDRGCVTKSWTTKKGTTPGRGCLEQGPPLPAPQQPALRRRSRPWGPPLPGRAGADHIAPTLGPGPCDPDPAAPRTGHDHADEDRGAAEGNPSVRPLRLRHGAHLHAAAGEGLPLLPLRPRQQERARRVSDALPVRG